MMFTDADSNEDTRSTSLLVDVPIESYRLKYTEVVPLTRDTDGPCTTDCDSGDWSAQVKQENLTIVKQEPVDDDVTSASCCTTSDAARDEVNETHSSMLEELLTAGSLCLKTEYNVTFSTGSCFYDRRSLTTHRNHAGEQLYSCSQCEKCFSSQKSLGKHMNIHTDKYKCTECGRCCKSSSELAVHKRSHSGEKPFECSVCSKRFRQSGDLATHSRIHRGEKPHTCQICSKTFNRSGHLIRHMKVHTGDKPYKCFICDKAFCESGSLNKHMRVHTGEKPYKCSLCDKSFSFLCNLQVHELHAHSNRRPHHCPYCGKLFKTSNKLKEHVRIHTGAKPYFCSHCSDSFARLEQLKRHLLKSHDEGAWLTCYICQKKFSQSCNLKAHVRRHEGIFAVNVPNVTIQHQF